ncbi:hypothetical protein H5410_014778 [Solanum commersonii]|uniref:Uncharacterized protein n=1 Tax=Solanum commersonii TaxID=4109 RepID=A0A9J5ZSE5_SOLCO|nr:hypothetical protein H5410_014778 [Solanum commersonii]
MIIPEKIEKQKKIHKIEIPEFYARKRVIGLATILNELATNYLSEMQDGAITLRTTMIYSNCRETRPTDMEGIRQWIMANYCKTIGHKYPDHQCLKCYGEANIIPAVKLE